MRRYHASADIYKAGARTDYSRFPDKVAIHLNESHAALIIPELMRQFVDVAHMQWEHAWDLTRRTCSFTNHQVFLEDLEKWPMKIVEHLLPRHAEIIRQINQCHMDDIVSRFPKELSRFDATHCVDRSDAVHMARLAIIGCHSVNGVSPMHTDTMKQCLFKEFHELNPKKICNISNGVTLRRWLLLCNPGLAEIICEKIGDAWPMHSEQLSELKKWARDSAFQHYVSTVKQENKMKLAKLIESICGVTVNAASLFDVHAKQFEGSKRQLLNILHVITLYNRIKRGARNEPPRTVIIAGKASPGDQMQKQIITLICDVAKVVNNDPFVGDRLKVVFLENYRVSLAEQLIPAADLSQHIALAGLEASATSNMKFALNGALLLTSHGGGSQEMIERLTTDNMVLFGMNGDEVEELRGENYEPNEYIKANSELKLCIDQICNGFFSPTKTNKFKDLADMLLINDKYFVLADYGSYVKAHQSAAQLFEVKN